MDWGCPHPLGAAGCGQTRSRARFIYKARAKKSGTMQRRITTFGISRISYAEVLDELRQF
jgi:hypothetical protein